MTVFSRILRSSRDESGVAMIIAVVLSSVIATLGVLMLATATHTDKATARGRHRTQALHVAESGIEQALARIQAAQGSLASTSFSGDTELGDYDVTITRLPRNTYEIESVGGVRRGRVLGAERRIKVTLQPPLTFDKALFSYTTVETKNNDIINGDVWGNHNVILALGTQVYGSAVAAAGYVDIGSTSIVDGELWSGGYNPDGGYAIRIRSTAQVGSDIKASVQSVGCSGSDNSNYKIRLDSGVIVGGDATTWGPLVEGSGIQGATYLNTCTQSPPTKSLPTFTFAPSNYDSVTYFGTPTSSSLTATTEFRNHILGLGNRISGTFYINQADPVSQSTRIDLTNTVITGDTTIITNTPIFTNGTTDEISDATLTLISTYDPPASSSCDVNDDASECSMHIKNNLSISGTTAVALYAPYGPVAIKNNAEQFGAIFADSIQIKNNQTLTYDDRVARIVGFGEVTYEVTRWEELPG